MLRLWNFAGATSSEMNRCAIQPKSARETRLEAVPKADVGLFVCVRAQW
jgi:hypothetical protein